jgi:hypothetical protein
VASTSVTSARRSLCIALLVLPLCSREANADLINPVFGLDALLAGQATADDTILGLDAVPFIGAHWIMAVVQLDVDGDVDAAGNPLHDDIIVVAQHVSDPPPHAGEAAPNLNILSTLLLDVVPGVAHAPAMDSVGHAGDLLHFNNLLVLYNPIAGGSVVDINVAHTDIAGIPFQMKTDPRFRQRLEEITTDPRFAFRTVPEPSILLLFVYGMARVAQRRRTRR